MSKYKLKVCSCTNGEIGFAVIVNPDGATRPWVQYYSIHEVREGKASPSRWGGDQGLFAEVLPQLQLELSKLESNEPVVRELHEAAVNRLSIEEARMRLLRRAYSKRGLAYALARLWTSITVRDDEIFREAVVVLNRLEGGRPPETRTSVPLVPPKLFFEY